MNSVQFAITSFRDRGVFHSDFHSFFVLEITTTYGSSKALAR